MENFGRWTCRTQSRCPVQNGRWLLIENKFLADLLLFKLLGQVPVERTILLNGFVPGKKSSFITVLLKKSPLALSWASTIHRTTSSVPAFWDLPPVRQPVPSFWQISHQILRRSHRFSSWLPWRLHLASWRLTGFWMILGIKFGISFFCFAKKFAPRSI